MKHLLGDQHLLNKYFLQSYEVQRTLMGIQRVQPWPEKCPVSSWDPQSSGCGWKTRRRYWEPRRMSSEPLCWLGLWIQLRFLFQVHPFILTGMQEKGIPVHWSCQMGRMFLRGGFISRTWCVRMGAVSCCIVSLLLLTLPTGFWTVPTGIVSAMAAREGCVLFPKPLNWNPEIAESLSMVSNLHGCGWNAFWEPGMTSQSPPQGSNRCFTVVHCHGQ